MAHGPHVRSRGGGERGSAEGNGHPSTCCLPRPGRWEIHRKFIGNSSRRGAGSAAVSRRPPAAAGLARRAGCGSDVGGARSGGAARGAPAGPGAPTRLSLRCKSRRDKLLINSREEAAVSFFLLFFPCFHAGMAPSYARGSLTAQQFSLRFNILKKMQIATLRPF